MHANRQTKKNPARNWWMRREKSRTHASLSQTSPKIYVNSREIFIDVKWEMIGTVLVLGKAHGRVHPSPIWSCWSIRDCVTVWLTKFRRGRTLAPSVGRSEKWPRKHDERFYNIFHLGFKLPPRRMPKNAKSLQVQEPDIRINPPSRYLTHISISSFSSLIVPDYHT